MNSPKIRYSRFREASSCVALALLMLLCFFGAGSAFARKAIHQSSKFALPR